ncbi:hypothetical protein VUN84_02260 [Micrococcaceae bacterium Sec5.8]
MTADDLDAQFAVITDARAIRDDGRRRTSLYKGNGWFSDVGAAESYQTLNNLRSSLRRGRFWFLRNS